MIDYIVFYAVSAIFRSFNGGRKVRDNKIILNPVIIKILYISVISIWTAINFFTTLKKRLMQRHITWLYLMLLISTRFLCWKLDGLQLSYKLAKQCGVPRKKRFFFIGVTAIWKHRHPLVTWHSQLFSSVWQWSCNELSPSRMGIEPDLLHANAQMNVVPNVYMKTTLLQCSIVICLL